MSRGQASTEFIIIMGISFIALLVLFTMTLDYFYSVRAQRDYGDALSAVQTLAAEADNIAAQGPGAEKMVAITLPGTTVFSANETYIGRPLNSLAGRSNTISINLNGTLVSATTATTIVGQFPSASGVYQMKVTSYGNFVGIGSHLVSADPDSVYLSMGQGSSKSAAITFSVELTSTTNESVRVALDSPWNYTNAAMNITPSSFASFGISDVPVSLDFTTTESAIGIYTSSLNVTAVKQAADNSTIARETFSVPITLEVTG